MVRMHFSHGFRFAGAGPLYRPPLSIWLRILGLGYPRGKLHPHTLADLLAEGSGLFLELSPG